MDSQSLGSLPAADWYPDPRGRHEFRYWDGTAWMQDVADGGQMSVDPVDAPHLDAVDRQPMQAVDARLSSAEAEYAKRGYKVVNGTFASVTMERAATKLSALWMIVLFFAIGVGCLIYLLIWAIWGVHKSYRVSLSQGPDGAIHEAGDVFAVFDRDRLRAHRNRLRATGWVLTVVGVFWAVASSAVLIFSPQSPENGGLAGGLAAVLLFGALPACIGYVMLRASRKASHVLEDGSAEAAH